MTKHQNVQCEVDALIRRRAALDATDPNWTRNYTDLTVRISLLQLDNKELSHRIAEYFGINKDQ